MHEASPLDRFIERALAAGQSRDAIATALQSAGWPDDQVRAALTQWAEVPFAMPVPRPVPVASARQAFQYLLLFLALYLSAWQGGYLLFALIEHLLPDAIDGLRAPLEGGGVRWAIALLVVTWLLYLWLARLIGTERRHQPMARLSGVRRWLTWMALLVSATVIVGDLATLVYSLLGGELSLRFTLKVGVVGAIAGSIFGWYLGELRADDGNPPAAAANTHGLLRHGRAVLTIATALLLALLVTVIGLRSSPSQLRAERIDRLASADLQQLEQAIIQWQQTHDQLPPDLETLFQQPGQNLPRQPAAGGAPYSYRRIDAQRFALCATYLSDSAHWQTRSYDWPHPAGEHCHTRRLPAPASVE